MRRTSTIATILGFTFWFSTFALARQDVRQGTGDLHGKVLDRDGKPLQGAIVRVRSNGTGQVDEGKTNKNGAFSLVGLTQGKYTATLIVSGQAVMQRGVDTGDEIYVAVSQDLPVNFDMRSFYACGGCPSPARQCRQAQERRRKESRSGDARGFQRGNGGIEGAKL